MPDAADAPAARVPGARATEAGVPGAKAPATRAAPTGKRLAWLDALRGIAALFVVFDHLGYGVLQHARADLYQWFDTGQYGVFVFFMVSGYIMPASLERKGSVRSFWVSRVFRLYPLYVFAILGMIALRAVHVGTLNGMVGDLKYSVASDVFMLQSVLFEPTAPNVVWSLAYEMVFYLMLTALFVAGVHRRSSRYALIFAGAALALGGVIAAGTLSEHLFRPGTVVFATDGLIFIGMALALLGQGPTRIAGAVLAGLTGLTVVSLNGGYAAPWESFTIFALMFLGTALYRAERGEYDRQKTVLLVTVVFGLLLFAEMWHDSPEGSIIAIRRGFITLVLAGATFAIGMACRHRKVPGILAWLGLVSYSVYLLHPLLIEVYQKIPGLTRPHPFPVQLALSAGFLAVLLGCCALTYRFIEAPMQQAGRALTRRYAWLGADSTDRLRPAQPRAQSPGWLITQNSLPSVSRRTTKSASSG
jgi:peptidoglycan/LPS O-acetylase OafA/YrhL